VTEPLQPATPPTTPEGANVRLAELSSDKSWGDRLVAGDTAVRAEFDGLTRLISGTDTSVTAEQLAARSEREANDRNTQDFIRGVREQVDVRDEVLQQVIRGEKVSQAEFDAAKQWQSRHFQDQAWVRKFLAGDLEAKKEHFLASVILASEIKETAK
jgi:hypothetical protein